MWNIGVALKDNSKVLEGEGVDREHGRLRGTHRGVWEPETQKGKPGLKKQPRLKVHTRRPGPETGVSVTEGERRGKTPLKLKGKLEGEEKETQGA